MTMIGVKSVCGRGIPDLNGFIRAARGNASAIGRPCQGVQATSMTSICQNGLTCQRIPYLYGAVVARGGDKFAIRRPGYCAGIAFEGRDCLSCRSVPYLYGAIIT